MQIVIDIPEETYKSIKHGMRFKDDVETIMEQIENGKPLPKGHGRLIDANRMKAWIDNCECCSNCKEARLNCNLGCAFPDFLDDTWRRAIDEQLTIIEADKEGAEEEARVKIDIMSILTSWAKQVKEGDE